MLASSSRWLIIVFMLANIEFVVDVPYTGLRRIDTVWALTSMVITVGAVALGSPMRRKPEGKVSLPAPDLSRR